MKKSIILFISIMISASLLIGCASVNCIKGSGKLTTEKRSLTDFTRIETDAPVKIYLTQETGQNVEIIASDNLQSHITSIVDDGVLKIDLDDQVCEPGNIVVYISTEVYEGLKISGAAQIMSKNMINAKDFTLDISGSSSVDMAMTADRISTIACCSTNIKLRGDAKELSVNTSGSSVINMLNLSVETCNIEASGSINLSVNILNALSINASGSCAITYKGNPEIVTNQLSGSSLVTKIN